MIERLLAAQAALDRGDLDRAYGLFHQVAGADPRNAIAVVGLARVAVQRGAPAEARELAHRALEIDADEAAARRLLDELDTPAPAPHMEPEPASAAPLARWRRWLARFLRRG